MGLLLLVMELELDPGHSGILSRRGRCCVIAPSCEEGAGRREKIRFNYEEAPTTVSFMVDVARGTEHQMKTNTM